MLQGMYRSTLSSFRICQVWTRRTSSQAKGSFKFKADKYKAYQAQQLLVIIYLIRLRASSLCEDLSENWRDTSARAFSSKCGLIKKVTTTFSCSRTRRGARTQKGLMCPSIRYEKGHISDEWEFLPQAGTGKNTKWEVFVDDMALVQIG